MPFSHPASVQAVTMRGDWLVFIVSAAIIGLIVYALILFPLVAWRERANPRPARFDGNPPLEITYTVIPLIIVALLFVKTYRTEMPVDAVAANPSLVVNATAFRWSWRFGYAGTNIRLAGTPLQPPTLYLPVDRTAEFALRTADVNHSFWVPAFLFKRDAIPGMTNRFDITPRRLGRYTGRCAQFCGLEHALMSFRVQVVPDDRFDRFIASGGKILP